MAGLAPLEFLKRYRALRVGYEDATKCQSCVCSVRLTQYYQYHLDAAADASHYSVAVATSSAGKTKPEQDLAAWYRQNKKRIEAAAYGKGAPEDYELALQWAVISGKIKSPSQSTIQKWCDAHLGIDCSGFATNYLIAAGKRIYSFDLLVNNSSASSYFASAATVNDPLDIRSGDLLLWIKPAGHIAVVNTFVPASGASGNMQVVESTGAGNRGLVDSWYFVTQIIDKNDKHAQKGRMNLIVTRFGETGHRVAVGRFH